MTLLLPWKRKKLTEVWTWPQIYSLSILGIWAEDVPSSKVKLYLKILRIFNFTIASCFSLSAVLVIIMKFGDQNIRKTLFALFTSFPLCFGEYKLYQIDRYRKPLKRAMDLLDDLLNETTDPKYLAILRRRLTRIWYFFIISNMLIFFACLHWYIRPLLIFIFFGEKTPIYEAWPLFMDTWLQFSCTLIFQIVSTFPLTIGYLIFDSFYFCISELILCHFIILQDMLEILSINRSNLDAINSKKIFKMHIKLLQICNNLQKASEKVMIIQTIITTISYCCGLFIIIMGGDVNVNVVFNLTESLITITLFFYLFCWYSNEIKIQSQKIGTSAYMSEWININENDKRNLIILMIRTDFQIIFGGFMKINLQTFMNAIKMTFTYYNFLRAVIGKSYN